MLNTHQDAFVFDLCDEKSEPVSRCTSKELLAALFGKRWDRKDEKY